MFSFTELGYESENDRKQRGTIELQGDYFAPKKSLWFVAAKLAALVLVVGFVYALVVRHVDFPIAKLTAIYFGILFIYCGLAYFIRPRANDSNLGMLGGMVDDPTQYSDDINRNLLNLEMFLQPGQVATETVLDFLNLLGIHEAIPEPAETTDEEPAPSARRPLSPSRFE